MEFLGTKKGRERISGHRKKGALRLILDAFRMAGAVLVFMIGTLLWT